MAAPSRYGTPRQGTTRYAEGATLYVQGAALVRPGTTAAPPERRLRFVQSRPASTPTRDHRPA